jgi:hypothetical protein
MLTGALFILRFLDAEAWEVLIVYSLHSFFIVAVDILSYV